MLGEPRFSKTGAALRNLALWIFAMTAILAWLPFMRSILDGPSYQWALAYFGLQFSGAGLSGDFWLIAVLAALAIAILYFGFRDPGRGFQQIFEIWLFLHAASYLYEYVRAPEAFIFEGETLGIRVNLGLWAFAIYAVALVIALAASLLERGPGRRPPRFRWTRTNSILFALALAPLPLQFYLVRFEPVARADEIGVLLTMAQWVALAYAFAANRRQQM